jgi:hypothetical protein
MPQNPTPSLSDVDRPMTCARKKVLINLRGPSPCGCPKEGLVDTWRLSVGQVAKAQELMRKLLKRENVLVAEIQPMG